MCSIHIPGEPEENWNNPRGHTHRCSRSPIQTWENCKRKTYSDKHTIERKIFLKIKTQTHTKLIMKHVHEPRKSCRQRTSQCWSYRWSLDAWGQRACGFPSAEAPAMSQSRCRQRRWCLREWRGHKQPVLSPGSTSEAKTSYSQPITET